MTLSRMFRLMALAGLTVALGAQTAKPDEDQAIQRFRAHARPRAVTPQAPLSPEEKNIIRRFREAKSSVVYISAIAPVHDSRTHATTKIPTGTGTGFVWDEWGHVVTNHHVITVEQGGQRVGEVNEVEVTLADGKTYKGRVIGTSFAADISVLQVFAPLDAMRPIPIGRSRDLQVGQTVLAIGNPFGLDHTLTRGVISALGREIDTGYGTRILDAIQTDAAVNPGNSGGPLLDSGGRLLGMNTAIAAATGASVGIGFAIPVDTLNRVVPLLIARERLEPPRMGFAVVPSFQAQQVFGITRGLVVSSVDPDSPASRAGLRPLQVDAAGRLQAMGDILLGYQGRTIVSEAQFMAMLEIESPPQEVVFDVLRDGQMIKVTLRLTPLKADPKTI